MDSHSESWIHPRAWTKPTPSTWHGFGFIGICLLLTAGGRGGRLRVQSCLGGCSREGEPGGTSGCRDGGDTASGRGGELGCAQLVAGDSVPVTVPRCQLCPAASPAAVPAVELSSSPGGLILPQLIPPGAQQLLPHSSAAMVSSPGCTSVAAGVWKMRNPSAICPGDPGGWTRSRRGGTVPLMHRVPKGWAGEPERDSWGQGPVVCWGDEAGVIPGWAGDGAGGDRGATCPTPGSIGPRPPLSRRWAPRLSAWSP